MAINRCGRCYGALSFSETLHTRRGLQFWPRRPILLTMVTAAKTISRVRSSTKSERTVVYRGIKIAPMVGKRSAIAQAIRDALRTKSEHSRAAPAHG